MRAAAADALPLRLLEPPSAVRCADVLVTTHHPVSSRFALHTKIAPYRTYALALRVKALEAWAKERFPGAEVAYRWSGQVIEPVDGLPFIGRAPFARHVWPPASPASA